MMNERRLNDKEYEVYKSLTGCTINTTTGHSNTIEYQKATNYIFDRFYPYLIQIGTQEYTTLDYDDILQFASDTIQHGLCKIHTFDPNKCYSFKHWLKVIFKNKVKQYLRKKTKTTDVESVLFPQFYTDVIAYDPIGEYDNADNTAFQTRLVYELIQDMPFSDDYKEIGVLKFVSGFTNTDIYWENNKRNKSTIRTAISLIKNELKQDPTLMDLWSKTDLDD